MSTICNYLAVNTVPTLCCVLIINTLQLCDRVLLTLWSCWPARCLPGCCWHRRPCTRSCPRSCWSYDHRPAWGFGGETGGTCGCLLGSLAWSHTQVKGEVCQVNLPLVRALGNKISSDTIDCRRKTDRRRGAKPRSTLKQIYHVEGKNAKPRNNNSKYF